MNTLNGRLACAGLIPVVALSCCLHGSNAFATLIEVNFSGQVTEVEGAIGGPDTGQFADAGVNVGDLASGTILYDTTTSPDCCGAEPIGFGPIYLPGLTDGFTINVGPLSFASASYWIGVSNDFGGGDIVNFSFASTPGPMPSDAGITLEVSDPGNIVLSDSSGAAIASNDPPAALDLTDFDGPFGGSLEALVAGGGAVDTVKFSIASLTTNVVPEPRTLSLAALGALFGAVVTLRHHWG